MLFFEKAIEKKNCSTLYVSEGLNKVITGYLDSITIQDIINKK